jgi:molybdate transport system substrate-binding protein
LGKGDQPRCIALLAAALVAAACGGASEDLVVAAAVSLREPVQEMGRDFREARPEVAVRLAFGATPQLAAQVRAGAPIDVLLSADRRTVEALQNQGLVAAPRVFARNRLVVLQRLGGPPLSRAEDLARPELRRIAVPERAVPVGHYARDWLARRGLLEAVEPRLVPTEHARATLAAVDAGLVDAAIVYASDARVARSARVAFEIRPAEQPEIQYVAARVAGSAHVADADAFLDFLAGPEAQAALARAGFAVP